MKLTNTQLEIMKTIWKTQSKIIGVGKEPHIEGDYKTLIELDLIHSVMLKTMYTNNEQSEYGFLISEKGIDFMKNQIA